MKYLSFDIEATGLKEDCLMIEFAAVPFDVEQRCIRDDLTFHSFIKCPSFEELEGKIDPWVAENMRGVIEQASRSDINLSDFKINFGSYLNDPRVREFFGDRKIVLFGKSLNAIDLPFMNRDLGWDWMRENFYHRTFDFSAFCYGLIEMKVLPEGMDSGTKLMDFLGMGDVAHTALEDAINTARMLFDTLDLYERDFPHQDS
jgi:DNA polymerase-3 subunit epsilon